MANDIALLKSKYIPLVTLGAAVFPSILEPVNSPSALGYLIPLRQCLMC